MGVRKMEEGVEKGPLGILLNHERKKLIITAGSQAGILDAWLSDLFSLAPWIKVFELIYPEAASLYQTYGFLYEEDPRLFELSQRLYRYRWQSDRLEETRQELERLVEEVLSQMEIKTREELKQRILVFARDRYAQLVRDQARGEYPTGP